jgi:hypothetical protein
VRFSLLTVDNAKTAKSVAKNYLTGVLHLAPFNLSGVNVCPMATVAGCYKGCLNTAGRGGIGKGGMVTYSSVKSRKRTNHVQQARIRRTRLFFEDRNEFMAQLADDIRKLQILAIKRKLTPCVRLNGTSDIRWEDIPVFSHEKTGEPVGCEHLVDETRGAKCSCGLRVRNIFERFPNLQFYDYTKIPNRRRALDIPNYHLTFSYSNVIEFVPYVQKAIDTYGDRVNIAVVFSDMSDAIARGSFLNRPLINGDEHDLRFLDPPGCVVALKAKGKAKKDKTGFVVRQSLDT